MLSKCANPNCPNRFLFFRTGKLFRWDGWEISQYPQSVNVNHGKPVGRPEFFWLCEDCSSHMTVVFRRGTGVTVRPILRTYKAAS